MLIGYTIIKGQVCLEYSNLSTHMFWLYNFPHAWNCVFQLLCNQWEVKDLGHFPYQSAHEKSMSYSHGITAKILTLDFKGSFLMSTRKITKCILTYGFECMLVISVPDT